MGAERVIGAERNGTKIVVEIKSFMDPSPIQDLKLALGQYDLYLGFLEILSPERKLYLAISKDTYEKLFKQKAIHLIMDKYQIPLIVVDAKKEEIVKWTKPPNTAS